MEKYRFVSVLILCVFLITLASQTLAAPIASGGSSTGFQPVIDSINNAVAWAEFEGLMDILIWLVIPALGIYAIFRFIFGKSFEYAEQNFKENSGIGRDDLSKTAEWSAKVLASVVSIITVVEWGGTFGWLMIMAGVAGLAAFIWHVVAGTRGTLMPHPFGKNDAATDDGQRGQQYDREEERVDETEGEIEETQGEIEDAGKTGNDEEARDAGQRDEKIIMTMDDIETDLVDLLNLEEQDLQKTIEGAQHLLEEEKTEIEGLRDIERRYNRTEALLPMLAEGMQYAIENKQALTRGNLRSGMVSGGMNGYSKFSNSPLPDNYSDYPKQVNYPGMKHVKWDIDQCLNDVQKVSQLESQEVQEVRKEVNAIHNIANNFLEAYDLIQKLKTEIDEIEKEDKELKQIAKELGDKRLMKLVEKEEEQELNLEKKVKQLIEEEEMIENELEKAAHMIGEELNLNQKEIQEIKQELPETQQIEQNLENIRDNYVPEINNKGGRNTLNNNIRAMENNLENIQQGMNDIEKRKENEVQMMREVENEIEKAVKTVG